jgi:hypothetical protein
MVNIVIGDVATQGRTPVVITKNIANIGPGLAVLENNVFDGVSGYAHPATAKTQSVFKQALDLGVQLATGADPAIGDPVYYVVADGTFTQDDDAGANLAVPAKFTSVAGTAVYSDNITANRSVSGAKIELNAIG